MNVATRNFRGAHAPRCMFRRPSPKRPGPGHVLILRKWKNRLAPVQRKSSRSRGRVRVACRATATV